MELQILLRLIYVRFSNSTMGLASTLSVVIESRARQRRSFYYIKRKTGAYTFLARYLSKIYYRLPLFNLKAALYKTPLCAGLGAALEPLHL